MSTGWDTIAEQWRAAYQQQADAQQALFSTAVGSWSELLGQPMSGPLTAGLSGLNGGTGIWPGPMLGTDQITAVVTALTEGPQLADAGQVDRRLAAAFELSVKVQSLSQQLQGLVNATWAAANQQFTAELGTPPADGDPAPTPGQHLRRWLEIANEAFMATHRSPEYLQVQQALFSASMQLVLAQRRVLEQTLVEPAGLPTRAEIDEVHHSVQDLKRRVRQLERLLRAATREGHHS